MSLPKRLAALRDRVLTQAAIKTLFGAEVCVEVSRFEIGWQHVAG